MHLHLIHFLLSTQNTHFLWDVLKFAFLMRGSHKFCVFCVSPDFTGFLPPREVIVRAPIGVIIVNKFKADNNVMETFAAYHAVLCE